MLFAIHNRLRIVITLIVIFLLGIWLGVPTFNKWRADRLVDQLCAKDGGINIYETVELSTGKFDQYGEIELPTLEEATSTDEFYYTSQTQWIEKPEDVFDLAIWRNHDRVVRAVDNTVLGEAVGYSRRGGDPVSPMHVTSYTCPENASIKSLKKEVLVARKP